MFSGIIEKVGKVESIEGNILRIKSDEIARSVEISESVSVSGACLTVIDVEKRNAPSGDPEPLSRTNARVQARELLCASALASAGVGKLVI